MGRSLHVLACWAMLECLAGCASRSVEPQASDLTLNASPEQCYLASDSTDEVMLVSKHDLNPDSNLSLIGALGVPDVEALAVDPVSQTLYGADADQLGRIDALSGAFTALPQVFGQGSGANGQIVFSDVDGLTFDPTTGLLYGCARRPSDPDVLFVIDPLTGAHVPDVFGPGVDYVNVQPALDRENIDDIAVDMDGQMYGVAAKDMSSNVLVRIDKRSGNTQVVAMMTVSYLEGLSFDAQGQLWGTDGDTERLYPIDKRTGAVGQFRPLDDGGDFEGIACLVAGDRDADGLNDLEENIIETDPDDADSDDDGVRDGAELEHGADTDGDGLINALDGDSDNDGIRDGTELGVTLPDEDTDVARGNFQRDEDPATRTSPIYRDTDGGGISDGAEDVNASGAMDAGETDPNDGTDDMPGLDDDGDGLSNAQEGSLGTSPDDADSDDDGVEDGSEPNAGLDDDLDGVVNALDPDSDQDGIFDGTELGVTIPSPDTDVGQGQFVPDADPLTITSALDTDTDRGTVSDGVEDMDHDGAIDPGETDPDDPGDDVLLFDSDSDGVRDTDEVAAGTQPHDADSDDDGARDGDEPAWNQDSDSDGMINALDPDSDNDRLFDGTELGVSMPWPDTDVTKGRFISDQEPSSMTNPLATDTDEGGVPDGVEDIDRDGSLDDGEGNPRDPTDDLTDDDGDGLVNVVETAAGTSPVDADSDDDGVLDGGERAWDQDTDHDGQVNALDADSDDDRILDGTELGVTLPTSHTAVERGYFVADADPTTMTDPLDQDSDRGGMNDGLEDINGNGAVDPGERDPNDPSDDSSLGDSDGDSITDVADNCPAIFNPDQANRDGDLVGDACDPDDDNDGIADTIGISGGSCSATSGNASWMMIGMAWLLVMRRRRNKMMLFMRNIHGCPWLLAGALYVACSSSPSPGAMDSSWKPADARAVDGTSGPTGECRSDVDCANGYCECADSTCSARVCVSQPCDCRYGPDCALPLDPGTYDPNSCTGEYACFEGMCLAHASDPGAPAFPDVINRLTVVVRTLDTLAADTNQAVTLCLSATHCFTLMPQSGQIFGRGGVESFEFEDLGLPRSQVDRVQLEMAGINDWYPACISLRFDGEPVYCVDPAPFRLGDNADSVLSWTDPRGLHVDCNTCYDDLLAHGPMVGAVEPDSARIWVRTDAARSTALHVWPGQEPVSWGSTPAADWVYPMAERDFTAVLHARGLQPDSTYHYAIEVDGQIVREPSFMFTTPPAKGQATKFTFAFGSCARYNHAQTIFAPISAADPDLFVFVGDTHYGNSETVAGQRWHYQWAVGTPTRAQMLAHTPTLGVWDDHDFVGNDSDGTNPSRDIARRVFMEYWANPGYGENNEGVYYMHSFGDVDFIVLDDRYFRDPSTGEVVFGDPQGRPSILGPRQTEWLLERLAASTATFKFVISGSQWTRYGRTDSWASYVEARNAIFDFIVSQGVEGVVLLSGDVHRAEFRHDPHLGSYDLPELTSSPLANTPTTCAQDADLMSCHDNGNYVMFVDVDTTAADPTLTARIEQLSGNLLVEVARWTIARSELGWPRVSK